MRLAGHLKKTLAEIDEMDSREFSQWIAWSRYFSPLEDSWTQSGMIASAVLAPYCQKGKVPSASDFVPIEKKTPQHWTQTRDALEQLKKDLAG